MTQFSRIQWNRKRSRITVYSERGAEAILEGPLVVLFFDRGVQEMIDYVKKESERSKRLGPDQNQTAEQGKAAQGAGSASGREDSGGEALD